MEHEFADGGARAPLKAHRIWAADPVHLPHIRAQTRRWLASLALDEDTKHDLVLAVNEAASNAMEHAYTVADPADLVTMSFWTDPQHLYVEVADHGRWRQPETDPGHRGRGILIMHQVVGSVSIQKDPDGTRVLLRHPTGELMNHATAHTNGDYLGGRAEVHQAAGMLTAQLELRIPEALARLEAHAVATGRPVLDVVRDVIAHRLQLSPVEPEPDPPAGMAPEC
jgi:anti-sigma regulatory factor (Ser/Thr protein kinase)